MSTLFLLEEDKVLEDLKVSLQYKSSDPRDCV